nr:DeoR/GlpR family DNA-binding transcription regulator [Melghirimyces algeriensis]
MKDERQKQILQLIDEKNFLKVSEASKLMNVTPMTIRRDLLDLEKQGVIERIHGGAKKKTKERFTELSHSEKREMNIEAKRHVAKKAAELIEDDDTVFIGAGTTTELIYDYLQATHVKVITNSLSIFDRFKGDPTYDLILIGGKLRERTGSFIGYFTRKLMQEIKVQKSFIGTNGIMDGRITTADEEESVVQQIILNNSQNRYIVADHSKFGVEAFQVICNADEVTAIITDKELPEEFEAFYRSQCQIIN